jgi:hypothetical protein
VWTNTLQPKTTLNLSSSIYEIRAHSAMKSLDLSGIG